jgi:hypothetical protein
LPLRLKWLWRAIAAGVALFLSAGFFYWTNHPGLTAFDCLYGNAPCSSAAAAWSIGVLAICSFAAAAEAIVLTARLLTVEIEPRLGQAECPKHGEGHQHDLEIFVLDDQILLGKRPIGYDPETLDQDYHIHNVGFTNLGRTALVSVSVNMHLDDDKVGYEINLGNIVRDAETHVVIYVSQELKEGDPEIYWSAACQEGLPIKSFYPCNPVPSEVVFGLTGEQLVLPGVPAPDVDVPADED